MQAYVATLRTSDKLYLKAASAEEDISCLKRESAQLIKAFNAMHSRNRKFSGLIFWCSAAVMDQN